MQPGNFSSPLLSMMSALLILAASCNKEEEAPAVRDVQPPPATPDTPAAALHRAVQYKAQIAGLWHWKHTYTSWMQGGSTHVHHDPDTSFAITFVGDTVVSIYGHTMLYDAPYSEYWAYSDDVTFSVAGSYARNYRALLYDTATKTARLVRDQSSLGGGNSDVWIGIK